MSRAVPSIVLALAAAGCAAEHRPPATDSAAARGEASVGADSATTSSRAAASRDARFVGEWVEPVPGQPGRVQGVALFPGGHARAIDMATLRHDLWRLEGDTLVVVVASVGNRVTDVGTRRFVARTDSSGAPVLVEGGTTYRRRDAGPTPAPRCWRHDAPGAEYMATLFELGDSVHGRLRYEARERDGNDGAFVGARGADGTIAGTYFYYSEGLLSERDVAFRVVGDTLVESDTPRDLVRGRFTWRGGAPTRFGGPRFVPVPCP